MVTLRLQLDDLESRYQILRAESEKLSVVHSPYALERRRELAQEMQDIEARRLMLTAALEQPIVLSREENGIARATAGALLIMIGGAGGWFGLVAVGLMVLLWGALAWGRWVR